MADDFDPDAYLKDKGVSEDTSDFNPDAYLASKGEVNQDPEGMGVLQPNPGMSKEALEAVPFNGATAAFQEGQRSGNQLLGNNIAGDAVGGLIGAFNAAGTVANPLTKSLNYLGKGFPAVYEESQGRLGNAANILAGTMDAYPKLKPSMVSGGDSILGKGAAIATNMASDLGTQAVKDPLNTLQMLEGIRNPKAMLNEAKTAYRPELGSTTSILGDSVLKGDKLVDAGKALPSGFADQVTSAFASDLPKGKKGVKVEDFKKAVGDVGIELHRSMPNIENVSDLHQANELTRQRAGQFLNDARQQQGLPNVKIPDVLNNVQSNLLTNKEVLAFHTPSEIKSALAKESMALTENFKEMSPDDLQLVANARKQLANKTFEQIHDNKPLTLDQSVNLAIYKQLKSQLDTMYKETPGADYARKVYGGTKVIDKGISALTEKLARSAYKDDPNLKHKTVSATTLLGTAATAAGHGHFGIPLLALKGIDKGLSLISKHLGNPNTKVNRAFSSLRKRVDVVQAPSTPSIVPQQDPTGLQVPQ